MTKARGNQTIPTLAMFSCNGLLSQTIYFHSSRTFCSFIDSSWDWKWLRFPAQCAFHKPLHDNWYNYPVLLASIKGALKKDWDKLARELSKDILNLYSIIISWIASPYYFVLHPLNYNICTKIHPSYDLKQLFKTNPWKM